MREASQWPWPTKGVTVPQPTARDPRHERAMRERDAEFMPVDHYGVADADDGGVERPDATPPTPEQWISEAMSALAGLLDLASGRGGSLESLAMEARKLVKNPPVDKPAKKGFRRTLLTKVVKRPVPKKPVPVKPCPPGWEKSWEDWVWETSWREWDESTAGWSGTW